MTVVDDATLIERSRAGDSDAYAQLYGRHVGVALGVARQVAGGDAEDVVSDAFARTLRVLREGGGPDEAFRPYLLRAVRNAAVDRHRRAGRVTPVESMDERSALLHGEQEIGDPVVDRLDQELAARAFATLPERWQLVLWHTEVQGQGPSTVAPLLGVSPRAVAQLAVRAREGLRTAWLKEHAAQVPTGHERVGELLAPSVRSSLGRRDRRTVDEHLASCPGCRSVRAELVDVNSTMGADVLPAVLGLALVAAPTVSAGAGGGGAAAPSGFFARVSGAVSHPVAAVAVTVVASGAGAFLLWQANQEPAPGGGRPAPAVSTPPPPPDGGRTTEPSTEPAPPPTTTPTATQPSTSSDPTSPPPTAPPSSSATSSSGPPSSSTSSSSTSPSSPPSSSSSPSSSSTSSSTSSGTSSSSSSSSSVSEDDGR